MPTRPLHRAILACLLVVVCGALPSLARAEGPAPAVDEILNGGTEQLHQMADSAPAGVLAQLGIEVPTDCELYRSDGALDRRAEHWTFAVRMLGRTHPDYVYGWVTGAEPPPDRVLEEVRTMRNCMLDALFKEASRRDSELTVELELEHGGAIRSPARARRWAETYGERPQRREQMREAVTRSMHRPVSDQTAIWQRKVRFEGAAFDAISDVAAKRCNLDAGDPWIPEASRHERCWRSLTPTGRGREILSASAAPGLSRHHWGSEVDLFGVTREAFRRGERRHDEYRWMRRRAGDWGFFQVYGPDADAYADERWHWSYGPIAGALMDFAVEHRDRLRQHLDALWQRIERRHNRQFRTKLSFDYVRDHLERYLVGISAPPWGREGRTLESGTDGRAQ